MSRIESFPATARPAAPIALADALGAIRAQIKALKACEAELRRALIEARPNAAVEGEAYTVTLRHSTRRVLDKSRLPAYIRDDPAFYRESRSTTVVTRPVRQNQPAVQPEDEDEFDVIERFA
ncbi:hypothetical protein FHY55_06180 [Oceanicola sp. D3]|uniref:hypothetical protein n=1 Tax=Oceanicola sp. D3 TaxID=2587163 RepID=UPI001124B705|nr:hypothetical protein [Oceanicola sp. D3]QDC08853.1 hypothetical protein FHY55_06180 [Oceanicola sp. D3]